MDKVPLQLLLLTNSAAVAEQIGGYLEQKYFDLHYDAAHTKQGVVNALQGGREWDIVICGHDIPELSPAGVHSLLLEAGNKAPLILLVSSIAEEEAIKSIHSGIYDVVEENYLPGILLSTVRAMVSSRASSQMQKYQQRLRELSNYLEERRENERDHIATVIHDELGELLTAIKLDLRRLHKECTETHAETEKKFLLLASQLDQGINTVRKIITELGPSILDDLGLIEALEWQLNEFQKRNNIECQFINQVSGLNFNNRNLEVAVFRIFQQSLANIGEHSQASEVKVRISTSNNTLELDIHDNGIGIAEDNKLKTECYGILGMTERTISLGGKLDVSRNEDGGTCVHLVLPLRQEGS